MPGSFSNFSNQQLYVEADEPPLYLRRLKLTLQNIVKLKAQIILPLTVFFINNLRIYRTKKNHIKSIGLRIQKHIDDSNIPLDYVKPVSSSKILPCPGNY